MGLCISREIREFVLGDLEEIAAAAAAGLNFKRTRIRLWLHFLRSLPFLLSEYFQRSRWRNLIRRDDLGRKADRRVPSILPAACLSLGLACCLTILGITCDFRSERDALSARPIRNAFLATTSGESAFAAVKNISLAAGTRTTLEIQSVSLVRARRLLGWEFEIMFVSSLVFVNRLKKRAGRPRLRDEIWRTAARSIGFTVTVAGIAILQTGILAPYIESLPEKRMLLYWLVSLWLLIGGTFNIVIAFVLPKYSRASRCPRQFARIYAAFLVAFLLGSFLIVRQLNRLNKALAAGAPTSMMAEDHEEHRPDLRFGH